MGERLGSGATPRTVHPGAWWIWAIGLAIAASATTNPLLLGLIIGVVALVVQARREDAPWGRGFGLYLRVGLLIVVLRVGLRIFFGGEYGTTVLFTLPEIPLPDWVAGIRIGGEVTAESILAAFYDGLRLATIVICFGAANSLANPKRLLRLLPNALYEVGAAVTVALSMAPQLAESVARVRRARRLRSGRGGPRAVLLPVLEDALDRSVSLAAAMDARGYGRSAGESAARRRATAGLLILGLLGASIGLYALLDASAPVPFGAPTLGVGLALVVVGIWTAGRRTRHTHYRDDPWAAAEWAIVASTGAALALLVLGASIDPASLHPSLVPLEWPTLAMLPTVGVLVAGLPAVLAPMPPLRAALAESTPTVTPAASTVQP
ncbi:MAG TPA: energy-coupling factor transporter transmembrane component T [Candidatus Limnocylindria bacterium]|jgi:energy-coupling factor transport system permease protein